MASPFPILDKKKIVKTAPLVSDRTLKEYTTNEIIIKSLRRLLNGNNEGVAFLSATTGTGKSTAFVYTISDWSRNHLNWNVYCSQPRQALASQLFDYVSKIGGLEEGNHIGLLTGARSVQLQRNKCGLIYVTNTLLTSLLKTMKRGIVVVDEVHDLGNYNILLLLTKIKQALYEEREIFFIFMSGSFEFDRLSEWLIGETSEDYLFDLQKKGFETKKKRTHQKIVTIQNIIDEILYQMETHKRVLFFIVDNSVRIEMAFGVESKNIECLNIDARRVDKLKNLKQKKKRLLILASNVVEVGVTIENIDLVMDDCMQKMRVFNSLDNSYMLARFFVTKNNALQREGRGGRTCDSIYIPIIEFPDGDLSIIPGALIDCPHVLVLELYLNYDLKHTTDLFCALDGRAINLATTWLIRTGFITAKKKVTELGQAFCEYGRSQEIVKMYFYLFLTIDGFSPVVASLFVGLTFSPFFKGMAKILKNTTGCDVLDIVSVFIRFYKKIMNNVVKTTDEEFVFLQLAQRIFEIWIAETKNAINLGFLQGGICDFKGAIKEIKKGKNEHFESFIKIFLVVFGGERYVKWKQKYSLSVFNGSHFTEIPLYLVKEKLARTEPEKIVIATVEKIERFSGKQYNIATFISGVVDLDAIREKKYITKREMKILTDKTVDRVKNFMEDKLKLDVS